MFDSSSTSDMSNVLRLKGTNGELTYCYASTNHDGAEKGRHILIYDSLRFPVPEGAILSLHESPEPGSFVKQHFVLPEEALKAVHSLLGETLDYTLVLENDGIIALPK